MMDKHVVLERYFLDCRCMLLELAATLDRLDRAPAATGGAKAADERMLQLKQIIQILTEPSAQPDRSAHILQLLSDPVG